MRATLPALALLLWATPAPSTRADELVLAGGAVVRGSVLKETNDTLFVDLGFAVLPVPRASIVARKSDADASAAADATGGETRQGLYSRAALPETSVREAVERFGEGVVLIKVPSALGSGFIISDEGHVVTNAHVVQGETEVTVTVYHQVGGQFDKKVFERVRLVAVNPWLDLALLQIEPAALGDTRLTKVFFGRSEEVRVGQSVFAVGAPEGLERSVSEGIVSITNRERGGMVYIQTTAALNRGNSGGPLFNRKGEVVGVNSWGLIGAESLGFAIPVAYVEHFLDNRDAYAFDRDNPNNGRTYLPPPRRPRR